MRDGFGRLWALAPIVVFAACASSAVPCPQAASAGGSRAIVYVVDHGWHTDIAVPAAELVGPLSAFRAIRPHARVFVFSYGKRSFMAAAAGDWPEYALGPLPGAASVLVTGLDAAPGRDEAPTIVVALPPGGVDALSDFLWHAFEIDPAGRPLLIAHGPYPGALFYAARQGYTLAHTCNTWTAEALAAAGTGVRPDSVVLAQQVMDRVRRSAQCRMPPPDRR